METVKFKLNENYSSIIRDCLLLLIIFGFILLYMKFNGLKFGSTDAENFRWVYAFLMIINIATILSNWLGEYFTVGKLKNFWGTKSTNIIEIPKSEFKGIQAQRNNIFIKTTDQVFQIEKNRFDDFDYIKNLPPYSGSINTKVQPKYYLFMGYLFSISVAIILLCLGNSFNGKYDLKYAIPAFQIETIQFDAKYIKATNRLTAVPELDQRAHKILVDSSEIDISSPQQFFLADKIFNKPALKLLPTSTPIKIKIRTKDYENYLKTGKFDKNLRFYELEANGDILYQKRGLREDFEIATF